MLALVFHSILFLLISLDSGAQPLVNHDGTVILAVNGEIYNHISLRKLLTKDHVFKTKSDCEVLLYLVFHLIYIYIFILNIH